MAGKQFSISVSNLASSLTQHRRNSAIGNLPESPTIEQRKHALSEESLPSMVRLILIERFSCYFVNKYNLQFNLLLHTMCLFLCQWMFYWEGQMRIARISDVKGKDIWLKRKTRMRTRQIDFRRYVSREIDLDHSSIISFRIIHLFISPIFMDKHSKKNCTIRTSPKRQHWSKKPIHLGKYLHLNS